MMSSGARRHHSPVEACQRLHFGQPWLDAHPLAPQTPSTGEQTGSPDVLCFPSTGFGGACMSKGQRFWLGLVYGAVFVLGAAYGIFEHQKQAVDWLTDALPLIKEILPFFLLLILALVVNGLFRAAGSVLERLNGVSVAAHSTLHMNYGKARTQTV